MRDIKFRARFKNKNIEPFFVHRTLDQTINTSGWEQLSNWEQFTGLKDKNGKDIYEGDVISLINDIGGRIIVICEFGIVRREIGDNTVDIPSFYFRCPAYGNKKTFPIVENYAGKHDLELFEIIGNIHENAYLLKSDGLH